MKRLILAIILAVVIILVLINVMNEDIKKVDNLVIFGDNIVYENKPFVENDCIYISYNTISKIIDSNIFYDELSNKIIITIYDKFLKYTIDETTYLSNLEEKSLVNKFKLINDVPFIPISDLQDIYDIQASYNEELNIISIDKKNEDKGKVLFNKTYIYSDIDTSSNVLKELKFNDEVLVYLESLDHNRWYKVKCVDNIVGYVFKDNIEILPITDGDVLESVNLLDDKVIMYWQYGNNLSTLTSEQGVNVVSPTLYEVNDTKGNITSKEVSDYVSKAHDLGYKVWPIITNGIDNVDYDPKDTSLLMNSEYARENLIRNIEEILVDDNIDGINIDFENMKKDDKYLFVQFLRELAPIVRAHEKILSCDIYFVEYMDRVGIGAAVDYTILMGYDQRGSWSSESGSIAEVPWVKNNINSMIKDSNIDSNKIIVGIPFYTRIFVESYNESKPSNSYVYTMSEAIDYVERKNLDIIYDENSMQNYIEFKSGNNTYKMWLEDETSIKNRVSLVNEMDLAGVAAWRKGFETEDVFEIISDNMEE